MSVRMTRALGLSLLLCIALGTPALAQGRIYRWTDAEGRVHYTDTPPPVSAEPDAPKALPAPAAPAEAKDKALLDQAQQGLAAGNVDALVSLFRYFEEVVSARDAAMDRKMVGYFLGLVKQGFGRAQGFQAARALSPAYVSARIESAAAEQWNTSDCLFKNYMVKTVFSEGANRRPVELLFTVCTGPRVEKATLRQVEFRFTNPDGETSKRTREVLTRTIEEARRLTGSRP